MNKKEYTREELLDIIGSYMRMIERDDGEYPLAVLSDIQASANSVLKANNYQGRYKECLY